MLSRSKIVYAPSAAPSLETLETVLSIFAAQQGLAMTGVERDSGGLTCQAGNYTLSVKVLRTANETLVALSAERGTKAARPVQKRLAALTAILLHNTHADAVIWLDTELRLPCDAFLDAVAPATPAPSEFAPRRVAARRLATRPRPSACNAVDAPGVTRLDAHVHAYEAHLRAHLRADPTKEEMEELRIARRAGSTGMRVSTWAMSLAVATVSLPVAAPLIVSNVVRGEDFRTASLAMGLAGFFVALDTTGTMTEIVTNL
ncbi:hypothetical protein [Roseivivax sp. THAF30]|uniref:hypothetical protein n=1 Tax=Roseivivax sp. THAF30 TaxID=2587852 RepID=UPI001267E6E6|nr:hypothetical protein [Roseivivax sp. THAF30]QFT63414.1 hypothetical protein FIU91_10805 [Roseivivax sp. THAF30]